MALYVRQSDDRSELQKRLATELQEKAKKKALEAERPDGVSDSNYLEHTKQTTSLAWVWVLIGIAIVALVIYIVIQSTGRYT